MRGKMSEMWAEVARVAGARQQQRQQGGGRGASDGLEWDDGLLSELEAVSLRLFPLKRGGKGVECRGFTKKRRHTR